jgi:hypothetical protein
MQRLCPTQSKAYLATAVKIAFDGNPGRRARERSLCGSPVLHTRMLELIATAISTPLGVTVDAAQNHGIVPL